MTPSGDPCPCIHLPSGVGGNLSPNQQSIEKVMGWEVTLLVTFLFVRLHLADLSKDSPAGLEETSSHVVNNLWKETCDKKLQVGSRTLGWPGANNQ